MVDVSRRFVLRGIASVLAPASSLSVGEAVKVMESAAMRSALSNLSLDELFVILGSQKNAVKPIKVDGKRSFNAESFSRLVSNSGIKRVNILRAVDAMQITPQSLYDHKEKVGLEIRNMLAQHFDIIDSVHNSSESDRNHKGWVHGRNIDDFVEGVGQIEEASYGQIADKLEGNVKQYIQDFLSCPGGKEAVRRSIDLLSRSDLKALEKQYGDVLPEDIRQEIRETYSSWHLEPVGGSGNYFKIVVSDDVSPESKRTIEHKAEEKLCILYQDHKEESLQFTTIGKKERWVHVKRDRLAQVMMEECEDVSKELPARNR